MFIPRGLYSDYYPGWYNWKAKNILKMREVECV